MHQALEGELYRRLRCLFVTSTDDDAFYLKKDQLAIDKLFMGVKLPHDFPKKMRSLSELGKWKAHEKIIFLFHLSLPALRKYLPSEYFYHHCLLVTGLRILADDKVREVDIDIAEAMLDSYIRLVEPMYGYSEMAYNLHSLGHFAYQTRNQGNPILQSAFVFEGMISVLKRKFHGTRGIIPQMLRNLAMSQGYQSAVLNNVHDPPQAHSFCREVFQLDDKKVEVSPNTCFYKPLKKEVPDTIKGLNLEALGMNPDHEEIEFSSRMEKDREVFHSEDYSYRRSSCSFFVSFRDNHGEIEYGRVQCFFKSPGGCFAVVKMVHNLRKNVCRTVELTNPEDLVLHQFQQSHLLGSHFTAVGEERNCLSIACEDIVSRVVFFPFEDTDFNVKGYVSPVLKTCQHN